MQKKKFFLALIAIAMTTLISCSKKDAGSSNSTNNNPVADFSYSGNGLAPSTVSFTNLSTNGTTYSWDFGDGSLSSVSSPTHTFTQGGVYTVRLTTSNSYGSNSTSKTVNIQTPTIAKITAVKIISMSFTDGVGAGWDNNTGPDVYFTLCNNSDNVLITGNTFNNVTSIPPYLNWNLTTPYQITNFASTYKLKVYDQDTNDIPANPDDYIGGYSFNLTGSANSGYPTTVTLYLAPSTLKIELTVQWL